MALSKFEIEIAMEKLRQEYVKLGSEFGEDFFSLKEFNRRFTHAEVYRIKMDAFLISELGFLEELKDKHDALLEKNNSFAGSFEKIAKKKLEQWNKYPRFIIHFQADEELCYFYGAVSYFYHLYTPVFLLHFSGSSDYFTLKEIIYNLEKIVLLRKNIHSPRIKEYQQVLDTSPAKSEKFKQNILKDGAIFLKQCYSFIEDYIHKPENKNYIEEKLPYKINWEKLDYIQKDIEIIKDLNILLTFQKSIGSALDIISTFSLQTFVK